MNTSPRTLAILADIAPALEAARRADGYYPPLVAVRSIIEAKHGEAAASTLYHNGLTALIQRHAAPLYSAKGARQFAAVGRKRAYQPLQGFDWFNAHPSPFLTALDWLHWKLERSLVGDVIRVRSDLRIVRADESAFKVYAGRSVLPVWGEDYGQAVAGLLITLLYGGEKSAVNPARRKYDGAQSGIVAGV